MDFEQICKQKTSNPVVEDVLLAWFQNIKNIAPKNLELFKETKEEYINYYLESLNWIHEVHIVNPEELLNGTMEVSKLLRDKIQKKKEIKGFHFKKERGMWNLDEDGDYVLTTAGFADRVTMDITLFQNHTYAMAVVFHHELQHLIQFYKKIKYPTMLPLPWKGTNFILEGDAFYRESELFFPERITYIKEIKNTHEYIIYFKLYYYLIKAIPEAKRHIWFQDSFESLIENLNFQEWKHFAETLSYVLVAFMKNEKLKEEAILTESRISLTRYTEGTEKFRAFLHLTYQNIQKVMQENWNFEEVMKQIPYRQIPKIKVTL